MMMIKNTYYNSSDDNNEVRTTNECYEDNKGCQPL